MRKFVLFVLIAAMLLPLVACKASPADEFLSYKKEQEIILKERLSTATTNDELLIIWDAQEKLRNMEYDGAESFEENKQMVDVLMETTFRKLFLATAEIEDYAADGLFLEDCAFSLALDAEGGDYTSMIQIMLTLYVSDASLKEQMGNVTTVGELFESAVLFFKADGTFVMENRYAELMCNYRRTLSPTATDAEIEKEIISGTYKISMEPNENKLYSIVVTKTDGSTIEFGINPKTASIQGQQVFENEIYKTTENAIMPQRTITFYLTENGYLKKNSIDAAKADYHANLAVQAVLKATGETMRIGDIYTESVVSFTEAGKAIITNHYTKRGQDISGVEMESMVGTYSVSQTPKEGTTRHLIRVELEENTVNFWLDTTTGNVTREDLFVDEQFVPFTLVEMLANQTGLNIGDTWTQTDGTILKDVSYGSGARNLMDIYVPANYVPQNANGVILFIHGGSWTSGSKEDVQDLCKKYAKMGYFTAAMNHTYAMTVLADGSKSTFLTINEEVGMAFAKLKELSDENGWNLQQASLYGYSSGCHVAYLYAYSDGNEENAPIPVKTVFGMVGSMDFRAEYWENVAIDGPSIAALGLNDERIISTDNPYSEEEYNAQIDSISPLAFAKRGDAIPSVMTYAMLDEALIDYNNGIALQETLNQYNIPNELYLLPNSGHMSANNAVLTAQHYASMEEYLEIYFGY